MRMHKWLWLIVGWLSALAMAACSPTGNPSPFEPDSSPEPEQPAGATEDPQPLPTSMPEPSETQPAESPADRSVRLTPTLPKSVERVPTFESTPITGEVPQDLLAAVIDDLIDKQKLDRDAIEVIRAEFVVWNDGSLGCPQPGVVYTQATVPGYWIVLRANDAEYDYRASDRGYFMSCDQGLTLRGGLPVKVPLPPSR